MSLVLPDLPGRSVSLTKTPAWSTTVKRCASGRERRAERWAYPQWTFRLAFEVVRDRPFAATPSQPITDWQGDAITDGAGGDILDGSGVPQDELQQLWELFNLAEGQSGAWLFLDPTDSQVTDGPVGVGDGVSAIVQLQRALRDWTEPVLAPFDVVLFDNGAPAGAFSLGPDGQVVFASPPAAGHALTWSGGFYYLCRFQEDALSLDQIVGQLWAGKTLSFVTVRP